MEFAQIQIIGFSHVALSQETEGNRTMVNRSVSDQRVQFVITLARGGRAGNVSARTSQLAFLPACLNRRGRRKARVLAGSSRDPRKVELYLATGILIAVTFLSTAAGMARAQPVNDQESGETGKAEASGPAAKTGETSERERALVDRIEQLERRVAALVARMTGYGGGGAMSRTPA